VVQKPVKASVLKVIFSPQSGHTPAPEEYSSSYFL